MMDINKCEKCGKDIVHNEAIILIVYVATFIVSAWGLVKVVGLLGSWIYPL